MIRIAIAGLVMHSSGVAGAEILDSDTLQKGTYRSASFSVW